MNGATDYGRSIQRNPNILDRNKQTGKANMEAALLAPILSLRVRSPGTHRVVTSVIIRNTCLTSTLLSSNMKLQTDKMNIFKFSDVSIGPHCIITELLFASFQL